mgnify:CR=1 FL=1
MNGLWRSTKKGFALIQLLIGLAIMALMSVVVIPAFRSKLPAEERKAFAERINSIFQEGWQKALITRTLTRVVIDNVKNSFFIEHITDRFDDTGKQLWERDSERFAMGDYYWPDYLELRNVFINGTDEMARYTHGAKMETAWIYIVPHGMVQPTIINVVDVRDEKEFGLVVNPFNARVMLYDSFQSS